jgi:hypothetical protein
MFNRQASWIVVLLVFLLFFSACSMVKEYKQKDDFSTKSEDFVLRMQWEKFSGAALHFKQELRESFIERFEALDMLKVTNVALSRVTSEFEGTTIRKVTHYTLEYYLLNELKVYEEKVKLVWELSPETEDKDSYWRIVSPFPELEVEKK